MESFAGRISSLKASSSVLINLMPITYGHSRYSVPSNDRLLCEQLLDLAEEFDGYLLLLIPTDESSHRRIDAYREALESRYIFSLPNEVFSHLPCFYQNER